MGAPDVDLDFDDLTAMTADLGAFVTEFEDIEDSTDDVQDAVGRPQGRTTLRSRVGDVGMDGNREVILDGLKNAHDHLKAIVDGFSETDVKLATPSPSPGPAPTPAGGPR